MARQKTEGAPQEWEKQDTEEVADSQDIPWLTDVEEGTKVEGTIKNAFLVEQDDGKLTVGFTCENEDGSFINFGERFFFRKSIRRLAIGSQVRIEFTEQKKIGKKKTQWLGTFDAIPAKGKNILAVLKEQNESREEKLPF